MACHSAPDRRLRRSRRRLRRCRRWSQGLFYRHTGPRRYVFAGPLRRRWLRRQIRARSRLGLAWRGAGKAPVEQASSGPRHRFARPRQRRLSRRQARFRLRWRRLGHRRLGGRIYGHNNSPVGRFARRHELPACRDGNPWAWQSDPNRKLIANRMPSDRDSERLSLRRLARWRSPALPGRCSYRAFAFLTSEDYVRRSLIDHLQQIARLWSDLTVLTG